MDEKPNKTLAEVYQYSAGYATEPVRALDGLYSYVDELLLDGYAAVVDKLFAEIDVERIPTVGLIGLLTLTQSWLRALPNRRGFFSRVEEKAERELGLERAKECLWGLHP